MTAREPSLSTLKRLAEAYSEDQRWNSERSRNALREAWMAYRAEIAPVRTRAEVDAEIATVIRMAHGAGHIEVVSGAVRMTERVCELCSEPTREAAPEPSPQRDPGPCSCDESLELRKTIASAHRAVCEAAAILGSEAPDEYGEVERLRKLVGQIRDICSGFQVSVCAGEVLRALDNP